MKMRNGNGIGKWDQSTGDIVNVRNYANSNFNGTYITKFVTEGNGDSWAS